MHVTIRNFPGIKMAQVRVPRVGHPLRYVSGANKRTYLSQGTNAKDVWELPLHGHVFLCMLPRNN